MPILAKKKKHISRASLIWSWRVCKQVKLSHFGAQKTRTHTSKSRQTQNDSWVRILVQRHNWVIFPPKMSKERPLHSMAIVIGPYWTNFCSQKLKNRILATFGFNRSAHYVPHSRSYTRCLMSLGRIGAAI